MYSIYVVRCRYEKNTPNPYFRPELPLKPPKGCDREDLSVVRNLSHNERFSKLSYLNTQITENKGIFCCLLQFDLSD